MGRSLSLYNVCGNFRCTRGRRIAISAAVAFTLWSAHRTNARDQWRQYAAPEEAGWSALKLEQCRQFAERSGSAAVFVVYRGHVLAAWGETERRFKCHSVRKSLLSALYGPYVAENRINLDKTLAELNIDDRQTLTSDEKQARIIDLLRARSGVYHPAAKEPRGMKTNRPARGAHAPGEHFWYNNWDFNTLGVIFEQEAGERIFDAFKSRIADRIGMQDLRRRDFSYQLEPSSSIHPAYAFRMSARDLARFGQLFLQQGRWKQRQVIPESWVRQSTTAHSNTERPGDYGYMWWVYSSGGFREGTTLDSLNGLNKFAASGTGGQFVLVVPKAELVFVHRGDTDNGDGVQGGQIWELAEMILDAKTGPATDKPRLQAVSPIRFANAKPAPRQRTEIAIDAAVRNEYAGRYRATDKASRIRTVKLHIYDDRLFAFIPGVTEMELHAEAKDRLFAKSQNVQVSFERDADGRVVRAIVTRRGRPAHCDKVR